MLSSVLIGEGASSLRRIRPRIVPPVSERQRRAMWAAAEGHSKLGIPKSVGEEFVRADSGERPALGDLTDHEAAEAIRDGELPSPTKYGDFWLFDFRITGTGAAYRDSINEYAFRDPAQWLSPKFVERCNGLPVIFEHPDNCGLNSEEFRERSIGSVTLPYIKGEDVWGVAKIFDADAAALMQTTHRSTSPGVTPPKGFRRYDDGKRHKSISRGSAPHPRPLSNLRGWSLG